jgi:hypothetical protein
MTTIDDFEKEIETLGWTFYGDLVWFKIFDSKRYYLLLGDEKVDIMPDLRAEGAKERSLVNAELHSFIQNNFQGFLTKKNVNAKDLVRMLAQESEKLIDEWVKGLIALKSGKKYEDEPSPF